MDLDFPEDYSFDHQHDAVFVSSGCFCFDLPFFQSRRSRNWVRLPKEAGENDPIDRSWWVAPLRSAREWSELVAGPRWKTFVRRFNRRTGRARAAKCKYDPLSYSLNFDHGLGQKGESAFSSRYSVIPARIGSATETVVH